MLELVEARTPQEVVTDAKSVPEPSSKPKLTHAFGLSIGSGLLGMITGSLFLSSAVASGDWRQVLAVLPIGMATIAIAVGWVGAFYWIYQTDDED